MMRNRLQYSCSFVAGSPPRSIFFLRALISSSQTVAELRCSLLVSLSSRPRISGVSCSGSLAAQRKAWLSSSKPLLTPELLERDRLVPPWQQFDFSAGEPELSCPALDPIRNHSCYRLAPAG